jgi:pantoate kinase
VGIAHEAEVECGTGLSGADAAAIGGILARRAIGQPPAKLPFAEKAIEIAFFSPMKTSAIIRDEGWKKKVNAAGEEALFSLFRKKSWGALVDASRRFTEHSGLGGWCGGELGRNTRASMAMLGQTLWSDIPLKLGRQPMKTIKCTLRKEGAGLV